MIKKTAKFIKDNKLTVPLIAFSVLLILIIIFYSKYSSELAAIIKNKDTFRSWLMSFGSWGKVIFVAIRSLQTVVKFVPAEPLEIGSGYVFGTFQGMLLCILGTEIGSFAIVLLTKIFGTKFINALIPEKKITAVQDYIKKINVSSSLFIIYLIPGTPKDLITYFIDFLPISIFKFFIITSIARIPSILTSTWCGSALGESNYILSAAVFLSTVVLGLGGAALYARYTKKKEKFSRSAV